MAKILVISSTVHKTLSALQLEKCVASLNQFDHHYRIKHLDAGSYEIPFVINSYQKHNPFDAYLALGLILKHDIDHFDYIMSHIKTCFTQFALNEIIVGNGIVIGSSVEELEKKITSPDPCQSAYPSAVKAICSLLELRSYGSEERN